MIAPFFLCMNEKIRSRSLYIKIMLKYSIILICKQNKNAPGAPTQSMVLADQQLEEKVIEGLAVGCCRGLV